MMSARNIFSETTDTVSAGLSERQPESSQSHMFR